MDMSGIRVTTSQICIGWYVEAAIYFFDGAANEVIQGKVQELKVPAVETSQPNMVLMNAPEELPTLQCHGLCHCLARHMGSPIGVSRIGFRKRVVCNG